MKMIKQTKMNFSSLLKTYLGLTLLLLGILGTFHSVNALSRQNCFVDEKVTPISEKELSMANKNSFHLFSHGRSGELLIEGQWKNSREIVSWLVSNNHLNNKSHLNIYGCEFAKDEKGKQAVSYLETALGVSIAASDDITGIDGDWDLEVGVSASAIQVPSYQANLQLCPDPKYSVFVHYAAGANNTNAARYTIVSSKPNFFVTVDQTNQSSSVFTALDDFSRAQEWVLLGYDLEFTVNDDITVRLEENASPTSSGMWINADAVMFVDQFGNRTIIDNFDGTQSGTWNLGTANARAYNNRTHYIQTGTVGTNIFTWTLRESEVIQRDDDEDGIPNGCDLDDDNDGILDSVECTTNDVTNGTFTGNLNGWTTTGNWLNRVGVDAYVNNDAAVSSDLSQIVTMNSDEGIFTYDLVAFANHTRNAFIEVYVDNVNVGRYSAAEIVAGAAAQGTSYYRVQSAIRGTCGDSTEILFRAIVEAGSGSADDVGVDNVFVGTCDADGDCIANHLEVDSDNDGCGDAIEATGSTYLLGDLDGGLGVDIDQHPIDTNGVPANSTNTGIGTSTNDQIQNGECDECDPGSSVYKDTDGDGIGNACDADDDNDGIEDCDERFTGGVVFTNPLGTDEHFFPNSYNTYTGSTVNPQNIRNGTMDSDSNGSGNFGLAVLNDTGGGYTFVGNHPISQLQILPYTQNVSGIFSVNDIITFDADVPITLENPIGDLKVYINGVRDTASTITTRAPITIIPRVSFGVIPAPDYKITMYEVREFSIYLASSRGTYPNGATFRMEADCLLLDTDGDGIPDNIDTDADGDGCPDALESTGSPYTWADLNPDGSINTALHPIGLDGFNGGNSFGEGTSKIDSIQSPECDACNDTSTLFSDNDGDGIGDVCDLDDDNDGILDADECLQPTNLASYTKLRPADFGITGPYPTIKMDIAATDISTIFNLPVGSVIVEIKDAVALDANNFVVNADINTSFEFSGSYPYFKALRHGPYISVAGSDGIVADKPGGFIFNTTTPTSGLVFSEKGTTQVIENTTTGNITGGSDEIVWVSNGFEGHRVTGFTTDTAAVGSVFGVYILPACDSDNDGVPNHLDLDSDNDGCSDALEGGSNITSINTLNDTLVGGVDMNGVSLIVFGGQGVGSSQDGTISACAILAANDINATWVNTPVNGNVLTNDVKGLGDTLVVNTTPVSGPSFGGVTLNADGTYTYTPSPGFTGTDEFTYEVCDAETPPNCDQAVVYITIDSLPNPNLNNEVIANNDYFIALKDSVISSSITSNDFDPDGNDLLVNTSPLSGTDSGSLTINPDGTFIYVPNPGFVGKDSFYYQVCDNGTPSKCDTALAIIEILPDTSSENQPPFAGDDFATTNSDTPVDGDLLANDYDLDSDSIIINTSPISGPTNGSIVINPDGTYTYTPNPGFTGTDQVVYELCDTGMPVKCVQVTLHITVGEPTPVLQTVIDHNTIFKDSTANGNILKNDYSSKGKVITAIEGSTITPSGSMIATPKGGILTIDEKGDYSYTPATGFVGRDTIVYTVCDTLIPPSCKDELLIINVVDVLDPSNPINSIISNPDKIISWGDSSSLNLLSNDSDPDQDLIVFKGIEDPNNPGTFITTGRIAMVPGVDSAGNAIANAGELIINKDGTVTFVPAENFVGTVEVTYQVCDTVTPPACALELLKIEVLAPKGSIKSKIDLPPFANDDFSATDLNTKVKGNFVGNDGVAGKIDALQVNGTMIDTTAPVVAIQTITTQEGGSIVLYSDGTFEYTPPTDFSGTDGVDYEICDTSVLVQCTKATIHLLVSPIGRDYYDLPEGWGTRYVKYAPKDNNTASGTNSFWLGSNISDEGKSLQNSGATGDMFDDGFIYTTILDSTESNNNKCHIIVNSSQSGLKVFYKLYIDWNDDKIFETTHSGFGITGSPDSVDVFLSSPTGFTGGYVNYRIVVQLDSTKLDNPVLYNGEIEDYRILMPHPLPVEFLHFSASNIDNINAKLNWATASELNSERFDIYRSTNGIEFIKVGSKESSGTTISQSDYLHLDNISSLPNGMIYYKLKQVDFNGSFEWSNVVYINKATTVASVNINPNPASDKIYVRGNNWIDGNTSIELYNTEGKLLKTKTIQVKDGIGNISISVSDLPSGSYILQVLGVTHKLIILK